MKDLFTMLVAAALGWFATDSYILREKLAACANKPPIECRCECPAEEAP